VVTDEGFQIIGLDDVEALPAPWTTGVDWRPLRHHLALEAFGFNAYTAQHEGAELVEEHDETGSGAGRHQEVYVVLRGRVRFTVGGREAEAGPGTIVAVTDPTVRRSAAALEGGATVVAIGGPADGTFRVSPWEFSFRAYGASRRGDADAAVAVMEEGLRAYPRHANVLYNLACYEARAGRHDDAVAHLRRALEADPELARHVSDDDDLVSIRDRPDWSWGWSGQSARPSDAIATAPS